MFEVLYRLLLKIRSFLDRNQEIFSEGAMFSVAPIVMHAWAHHVIYL